MTIPQSSFDDESISQAELKDYQSMPSSLSMMSLLSSSQVPTEGGKEDGGDDDDGDASSSSSSHEPSPIVLPQHEWNEMMEEFSENSEDLFKVAKNEDNNDDNDDDDDDSSGYWTSYNDDIDDGVGGYNQSWYQSQHDTNNSWIPNSSHTNNVSSSHTRASSNASSSRSERSLPLSSAFSTPQTNPTKRRKKATGSMVWIFREGIDGMEKMARLVGPLPGDEASFSEDVEIQWKDGSFDWVSRDDVRLVQENAASFHSRGSYSVPMSHHSRDMNNNTAASSYHSRGSSTLPSPHSRDGASYNVASFHSRGSPHNVTSSHSRGSLSYYDDATLPLSLSPMTASPGTKQSHQSSSSISPREEMMNKFRHSELSSSGRRIMQTKNNIITSDYEWSSSSDDTLEDEEALPVVTPSNNIRGKLGNMLDASILKVPFRSPSLKRSSHHSPKSSQEQQQPDGSKVRTGRFRSSSLKRSSNHSGLKQQQEQEQEQEESVGDAGSVTSTPSARRRGLPSFPFSPQAKRSSSLGKRSPRPPSDNNSVDTPLDGGGDDGGGMKKSSSFHHDQRRARKGFRKQAFKSKSADSQHSQLMETSPSIVVQAIKKKRSNSAHSTSSSPAPSSSQTTQPREPLQKSSSFHHQQRQQQPRGESLLQKSSSFHKQQRALQRKNSAGSKSTTKSKLNDLEPTEAKALWAEMYASSPELGFNTQPSTPTIVNKKRRSKSPRSSRNSLQAAEFASPVTMEATKLHEGFHASSPEFGDFAPTADPSNFLQRSDERASPTISNSFHHEQRKARKGTKKKAFKSRSADAPPSEWHDSEIFLNASSSSLSSSMHNLIKPEGMKVKPSSYHHDQRKSRAKAKQQKSRSADSLPSDSEVRMEQLKLSSSMHIPGEEVPFRAVPRRKNSLRRNNHRLSPMSNTSSSNSPYRHSTGILPSAENILLSPEQQAAKKKASLRKSDPGIAFMPDTETPRRNTSLRRSNENVVTPDNDNTLPRRNTSLRHSDGDGVGVVVGDTNAPRRKTSLRRSDGDVGVVVEPDTSNIPRRSTSLRRSDGDIPKRNSSLKLQRDNTTSSDGRAKSPKKISKSPKRSSKSPKRNSSLNNRKEKAAKKPVGERSGIAYLQQKKNQQEEQDISPIRSKRSGARRSKSPMKEDGKPRILNRAGSQRTLERTGSSRSVTNVDSRITLMKKSNSQRKLERSNSRKLVRSDSNRSVTNVDSRITLMKKSNSQRKLAAVSRSNSQRQLNVEGDKEKAKGGSSDMDASVLAILKKKKKKLLTQQSSARKLLVGLGNSSTDVASAPSPISTPSPVSKQDGRKFQKSSSTRSIGVPSPTQPSPHAHSSLSSQRDWNDSFVKRAAMKSKLETLNDRMSTTIGVEASPGVRLRKQGTTLEERRAASRESRINLKNAFQRMIQQPDETATEKMADENNDSNTDLEVPMNN